MPRVLIVTAHFPPANTPDMQRVRISLPHFVDAGWEITVLTAEDREPIAPLDPDLMETIPRAVRVVRAPVFSRRWTRRLGINNLGLRALPFFYRAGNQLLREKNFDLVYFSTTQFILMPLGRYWLREFGVPYVIDLQDPWVSDYYSKSDAPPPPGGWKYRVSHFLSGLLEGPTIMNAAHVISVSWPYLQALEARYPGFWADQDGTVLPFGTDPSDYEIAERKMRTAPPLLPPTKSFKIVYAGRLGPDMLPALQVLFAAVSELKKNGQNCEVFFYGTSYAPALQGKATTRKLAGQYQIEDRVHEYPDRIGYVDARRIMLEADMLLLLGSNDMAYSPSKIYSTLLAPKSVLAVAPINSVLERILQETGGAEVATFDLTQATDLQSSQKLADRLQDFFQDRSRPFGTPKMPDLMREHTAEVLARKQLAIFNNVIRFNRPEAPPVDFQNYLSESMECPP